MIKKEIEDLISLCLKNINIARNEAEIGLKEEINKLENHLTTWQNKLDVLLKEPAARKGMMAHAEFWIKTLSTIKQQKF